MARAINNTTITIETTNAIHMPINKFPTMPINSLLHSKTSLLILSLATLGLIKSIRTVTRTTTLQHHLLKSKAIRQAALTIISSRNSNQSSVVRERGPLEYLVGINQATSQNQSMRKVRWTSCPQHSSGRIIRICWQYPKVKWRIADQEEGQEKIQEKGINQMHPRRQEITITRNHS